VDFQERVGGQGQELINLIKLAVGVRDVAHLQALQKARAEHSPPLRHFTRNFPKRAAELLAGGSMYWVIGGIISVRQRLVGVERATESDGMPTTALVLDPALLRVEPRPMRAFQGWRYLESKDAPPDLGAGGSGSETMPEELRRKLAALGLL
jgi:hypothetical protein